MEQKNHFIHQVILEQSGMLFPEIKNIPEKRREKRWDQVTKGLLTVIRYLPPTYWKKMVYIICITVVKPTLRAPDNKFENNSK